MEYIWIILTISWLMFVRCDDFKDIQPQDFRDRELSLVSYDGPAGGPGTGSAVGDCVIDTDLPSHISEYLMWKLQKTYQDYPTANQRAARFKNILDRLFPYNTVVVIINFDAAQYYAKWYFMASIQGDRVLAFGF